MRWSKYLLFMTAIVYASGNMAVSHAQETGEWYEKKDPFGPIRIGLYRADPDVPLIESLDIHELVASVFPDDYISESSRPSEYFYVFQYRYGEEYGEHAQFRIECGVYPSVRLAEEATLDHLLLNSFWIKYGASDGETIGDNSWYNPNDVRFSAVVYKNLYFFFVFPFSDYPQSGFESAEYYTRELVEQIKAGADFVTIKDTIAVPEITGLIPSKSNLALGDTCSIRAEVFDPLNRPLQLDGSEPLISENTFYFEKNTTEPEEFKACAVTDGYLYSEIKSITIGF